MINIIINFAAFGVDCSRIWRDVNSGFGLVLSVLVVTFFRYEIWWSINFNESDSKR